MNYFRLIFFILLQFFFSLSSAQKSQMLHEIEAYYEGAVISDNSLALMSLEIIERDDTLFALSNVKEWTYYPDRSSIIDVDNGIISFESYYGNMRLSFDSLYGELLGKSFGRNDTFDVHFKKIRKPAEVSIEKKVFSFVSKRDTFGASIYYPKQHSAPLSCAIFVHGRGCYRSGYERRAKILSQYGIATVAFDKRGFENREECNQNSIDTLSDDLLLLMKEVEKFDFVDRDRIGLIGYSFGGWLSIKTAMRADEEPAFLITVVGPATSIKEQQLDNAVYFTKEKLNGDPQIVKRIQEYTLLEYDESDDEKTYKKMMALLEKAKEEGWYDILAESDIPDSPEDMKNLWVRRNKYNPERDLFKFKGPYLSILGSNDRVVPFKENSARLEQIFIKAGKSNYRIKILPEASHALEHGDLEREIKTSKGETITYTKFDRVAPGAMQGIIDFLRDYDFLE